VGVVHGRIEGGGRMDGNGGGKNGDVMKGALRVGGMKWKDGGRGGSAWVAARFEQLQPRTRLVDLINLTPLVES